MEYLVAVHGIFIEGLLNKNWNISRYNINQEKQNLTNAVRYFTDWISEKTIIQVEQNITASEAEKYYMATKTYKKLLFTFSFFCEYA